MTVSASGAFEAFRSDSHASRVARIVIERIRTGDYPVGSRLPSERALATEFAVSRPVVREALSSVGAMDLLDVQIGRGAFVRAVPREAPGIVGSNLQDVVNVREVLETGALHLAGLRASEEERQTVSEALEQLASAVAQRGETIGPDRALHKAIISASGSPLLVRLWEELEQQIEATIKISPHGRLMSAPILKLHRILAAGVLGGETPKAISASRELHQQNRDFLRELLG